MRRFSYALFALLVLASPRAAWADEAAARAHFKKGIELYDKKLFVEALSEFQDAYREKPSAGIKQNIALCLKGLNRPADAASAFDEALDEGKDTLKPETKAAIERELTELSRSVATVKITIVGADEKKAAATVISITPAGQPTHSLAPGAQRRPIRLMPGIYTFSAKIPGQADPEPKKFALVTGAPVDASFGSVSAVVTGTLTIRANVPDASIRVDGAELGQGTWTGPVPAGKHKAEVSAPGWKTVQFDVSVPANATVESPVTLQPASAAPGEYVAPVTPPPEKPKRIYLVITGALEGASYRFSDDLGETPPSGERRGVAGLAVGGRFGFLLNKVIALEAFVAVGQDATTYKLPSANEERTTQLTHWQLTPSIRFQTPGKSRFTAATGFGVHGLTVESTAPNGVTRKGSGVAASWLIDAGGQFDLGPLFLEACLFFDVHGVGSVADDAAPDSRFLLASPAVRGGLRVGLGIPF
ncbi:MAG: PEGA domain-containing protein [Labilithrix sp.]|nr:PEGA domain-containing protein [Labilithrix sp.]MCW5809487.1 PEGA domain-containing protein [Labilithrix sp.]